MFNESGDTVGETWSSAGLAHEAADSMSIEPSNKEHGRIKGAISVLRRVTVALPDFMEDLLGG